MGPLPSKKYNRVKSDLGAENWVFEKISILMICTNKTNAWFGEPSYSFRICNWLHIFINYMHIVILSQILLAS